MMKLTTNSGVSLTSLPVLAALFVGAICGLTAIVAVHANAASETPQPSNGKHLVTIHDNSQTQGILTKDTTLRQVFHDANIPITDKDLVEPSLDTQLTADNYEVNVYRARPIIIVDGMIHKRVMTPYRTPDQIVAHAGMTLHDEDKTTLTPNRQVVAAGPGLTLTIDRATPFTLIVNGKTSHVYTQGKTVRDMLAEKNVTVDSTLSVSPSLSSQITAGMTVKIWRDGKHTITQRETVKFSTKIVKDADQPTGYHKVTTKGKNGSQVVTYTVSIRSGEIIKKKPIQKVVTKKPVQQVEIVGTKVSLPPGSHTDWMAAGGINSSDYDYASAIFAQESHWNPAAANSSGYYGLGQTSLSNISGACGSQWASKPICQIKYFNTYKNRYGSWRGAYIFKFGDGTPQHPAHGWW